VFVLAPVCIGRGAEGLNWWKGCWREGLLPALVLVLALALALVFVMGMVCRGGRGDV